MSQDTTPDASSTLSHRDIEITSVADFLKAIEDVSNDPFAIDEATEVFYRGHADKSWDLTPSIFMSDKGIENEHFLFRDMVIHMPRDFSECKSALDYLVQMQHYGLPTRLLDVTTNPLIALYFACQPAGDTTVGGIVDEAFEAANAVAFDAAISVDIDSEGNPDIYHNAYVEYLLSSVGIVSGVLTAANTGRKEDPIADRMLRCIVAPLERESPDLADKIKEAVDAGRKAAIEAGPKDGAVYLFSVPENRVKYYDSDTFSILSNLVMCGDIEINIDIDQNEELATKLKEEEDVQMGHEDPRLKAFNSKYGIQNLLPKIREEKPYFQALINPFDLCRAFLVKAKHGNPRIVNQAGAFFLFGLQLTDVAFGVSLEKGKGKEVPRVPVEWIKKKLIIPEKFKADILEELQLQGITESYIYPGIEQYAKELKKKYVL